MRSIAARFLIPVGLFVVLFSGVVLYRTYSSQRQQIRELMDRQAALALRFDLAIRSYVAESIRPEMEKLIPPNEFFPETMSTSFVARSIFEKVRRQFPDYVIKFSSDNPRNAANKAGPAELKAIRYFNAHPDEDTWTGTTMLDGQEYLAHFSARRMKESCLRCHGRPEDAPASLVRRYGPVAGFHRPVGQVIALDTVAMPLGRAHSALFARTLRESAVMLGGLTLLFCATGLLFRSVVTRRLARIAAHFEQIAADPESGQVAALEDHGRDEISVLARRFNALAAKVSSARASLERRVAERTAQLERANRRAEAASRAKSEFLANMSHEIRTPMTAILGYVSLIEEGCAGRCEYGRELHHEHLATIMRNGQHLLQLINDILDISRIEAGELSVQCVPCSPVEIAASVRSMMEVRAREKGLDFEVRTVGAVPREINSDPVRLRQILINLVGNAIKFTERGSVQLIVRYVDVDLFHDTGPEDAKVLFEVVDTGVGLKAEQTSGLFQPFVQADASVTRNYGGTGLGLAISRRLARALGGDITIETNEGKGSTFRVLVATGLPQGAREGRTCDAEATVLPVEPPPTDEPLNCRILLAEDGPDNQRLLSYILRKAGAEVTVVENGLLAVDAALSARDAHQSFDVILMDMQMPVLDGYEATRELRKRGYGGCIVALTAHAMAHDRAGCLAAGCDDYASKPIDRGALLGLIHQHVSARATTWVPSSR